MNHIEELSSNAPKTSDDVGEVTPSDEPAVEEPVVEEPDTKITADIAVTVLDADNKPINGASVTVSNGEEEYTGNTGSAGGCNIRNVPLGDYNVTTIKTDYIISEDDITVVAGENTLEIILEKEQATYSAEDETFDDGGL